MHVTFFKIHILVGIDLILQFDESNHHQIVHFVSIPNIVRNEENIITIKELYNIEVDKLLACTGKAFGTNATL